MVSGLPSRCYRCCCSSSKWIEKGVIDRDLIKRGTSWKGARMPTWNPHLSEFLARIVCRGQCRGQFCPHNPIWPFRTPSSPFKGPFQRPFQRMTLVRIQCPKTTFVLVKLYQLLSLRCKTKPRCQVRSTKKEGAKSPLQRRGRQARAA